MHNYYDASYADYFISLVREPVTFESLVDLAQQEFMRIDIDALIIKLGKYDLDNLSEQDFYDVIKIVLSSNDIYRLRSLLHQTIDQELMLTIIANVNPRINIPKLKAYLSTKNLPLSNDEVLAMERVIENDFYHSEIERVSQWDELLPVLECFSPRMSFGDQKSA